MNGSKAKKIRREVYGDISLKVPRRYQRIVSRHGEQIVNAVNGLRARYQKAKGRPGVIG